MALNITLPKKRKPTERRTWHGMAVVMESLVLIVFLILSISVLMQVFSVAKVHNDKASSLSYSVILASNEAERFNTNPSEDTVLYYALDKNNKIIESDTNDASAFQVTRTVQSQQERSGTLYLATITVERFGEVVYELSSSSYVQKTGVR